MTSEDSTHVSRLATQASDESLLRTENVLYSLVLDEQSTQWHALVLEKNVLVVKIFDGCSPFIKDIGEAVEEHYHYEATEVGLSLLAAAVIARKKLPLPAAFLIPPASFISDEWPTPSERGDNT